MATIRSKHRFGKRFIRLQELRDYFVDLDLSRHPPFEGLIQFFEEHDLLTPVRRINIPPEIVRRLHQERYPRDDVTDPIEPDGPRLNAAAELMNAINTNRWAQAKIYGERVHVLDALAPADFPFIQTEFQAAPFQPWGTHRARLCNRPRGAVCSSRLLKNPPVVAGLVGLAGFLGLPAAWIEACGPLAAGLRVYYVAPGHQVGASARSLGSLTRL